MNHSLLEQYIKQLEQFQQQVTDLDREYSDNMMYAIHDRIIAIILCKYTPPYKFVNSSDARDYVIDLTSEYLYEKLDITDHRWKRLLNEQHELNSRYPYILWTRTINLLKVLTDANTSNLQSKCRD
jgi:hypothetical protein